MLKPNESSRFKLQVHRGGLPALGAFNDTPAHSAQS